MEMDFESFAKCFYNGVKYIPNTLLLVSIPFGFALIFGTLIAYARVEKIKVISPLFAVFISLYRGVPTVVALLLYNLFFLLKFDSLADALGLGITSADIDVLWIAVMVLSVSQFCGVEENMRSAFLSINKGQWEAGFSVGMTKGQVLIDIIMPQVIPVSIPSLTNSLIGLIKNSSIVISIGVVDIMAGCAIPANINYRYLEAYLAAAVIYWGINMIVEFLLKLYEKYGSRYKKELA